MGISALSQITDISLSVFQEKREEIAELLKLCLNNSLILTFVFQEDVSCDFPFPEKNQNILTFNRGFVSNSETMIPNKQ